MSNSNSSITKKAIDVSIVKDEIINIQGSIFQLHYSRKKDSSFYWAKITSKTII
jgi:hypothetical protein